MRIDDLVAWFDAALNLHPPRPWLHDAMRLDVMKAAFPRPELLAWFDDEGGDELDRDRYGVGLLLRTAIEWNRTANVNQILTCGRGATLSGLNKVRRPEGVDETIWRIRDDPPPDGPASHLIALIFGYIEEVSDLPTLIGLLRRDAPNAIRLFVLSDAVDRALSMALQGGAAALPGFEICHRVLQTWPDIAHVALCRSDVDPGPSA